MAALSLLRSLLKKDILTQTQGISKVSATHTRLEQLHWGRCSLFLHLLSTLHTQVTGQDDQVSQLFLGEPNWYKIANFSLFSQWSHSHIDQTQSSCFTSFSQSSSMTKPNRNSYKSTEDTEPEFTQCQALDPQQEHNPNVPSKGSRAELWWPQGSPEASQQGKPRSEVSKARSGPARYLTGHKHTYSIAQTRAKGKVFELTNTSWSLSSDSSFVDSLIPPIFASCKYLDTPTPKAFSFEILNLSKEQILNSYIHAAFNSLISLLAKGTQNWVTAPKTSILLSWTTLWDQEKHPLSARGQTSVHKKQTCALPTHLLLTFLSDTQQGNWRKGCPLYISMHFGGNWPVFLSQFTSSCSFKSIEAVNLSSAGTVAVSYFYAINHCNVSVEHQM